MVQQQFNCGKMLLSFQVLPAEYLDEASRWMIDNYGLDFTLTVIYGRLETSMTRWPIISAGVPPT
jgi:hypothetical protein